MNDDDPLPWNPPRYVTRQLELTQQQAVDAAVQAEAVVLHRNSTRGDNEAAWDYFRRISDEANQVLLDLLREGVL